MGCSPARFVRQAEELTSIYRDPWNQFTEFFPRRANAPASAWWDVRKSPSRDVPLAAQAS